MIVTLRQIIIGYGAVAMMDKAMVGGTHTFGSQASFRTAQLSATHLIQLSPKGES